MLNLFRRAALAVAMIGVVLMSIDPAFAEDKPVVALETSKGTIYIELDAEKAPKTTENFLWYVDAKFYDGLVFHRVIKDFMIQGGGFTKDMVKKKTKAPIQNEANNGLKNERGTIAMARTPDPHSGSSQFFINLVDNHGLNFKSKSAQGWGYCVFGKVVEGMDVVDAIGAVNVASKSGYDDVPATPIVIEKAYVAKDYKKPEKKEKAKAEKTEG